MRIDSSGNVGIGTTSPSSAYTGANNLVIGGGSAEAGLTIYSSTTTDGNIYFADGTAAEGAAAYRGYLEYSHNSNYFRIGVNGSEAMRIDSSGNLLVGKTSANSATVGQELKSSGVAIFTQSANPPIITNRLSTDGEIVNFRKDGTTVGSIGTNLGDLFLGTGNTGISFYNSGSNIIPYNLDTASYRDAGVSLGYSTYRFKDLYLSGGVYLGGTGSANLLDDYEEGTWTPVLTMTTSGDMTATVQGTAYTKVGRMVHFQCYISAINGTSPTPSGEFRLTGLPFASKGSNTFTPINISYASILANQNDVSYGGYVQSGDTFIRFTTGGTSFVDQADIVATSGGQIMVSGVYQTA